MHILKTAAEACGRDTSQFGTHSLRRGGASSYIMAGKTLEEVALFGRWADMRSLKLYVEPAVAGMMKGAQDKVNKGEEEPYFILKKSPRPRTFQKINALRRAAEM